MKDFSLLSANPFSNARGPMYNPRGRVAAGVGDGSSTYTPSETTIYWWDMSRLSEAADDPVTNPIDPVIGDRSLIPSGNAFVRDVGGVKYLESTTTSGGTRTSSSVNITDDSDMTIMAVYRLINSDTGAFWNSRDRAMLTRLSGPDGFSYYNTGRFATAPIPENEALALIVQYFIEPSDGLQYYRLYYKGSEYIGQGFHWPVDGEILRVGPGYGAVNPIQIGEFMICEGQLSTEQLNDWGASRAAAVWGASWEVL